jgi:hypothetical protein
MSIRPEQFIDPLRESHMLVIARSRWSVDLDHRILTSHTIGVWRRPPGFGVVIAFWNPINTHSPTYALQISRNLATFIRTFYNLF